MNHAHRLAQLTAMAAIVAAGLVAVDGAHAAGPTVRIIELPRVTVVAKRWSPEPAALAAKAASPTLPATPTAAPRIIELPRVLVVAKRPVPQVTVIAERNLRGSGA